MLRSHHQRNKPRQRAPQPPKRRQSYFGTKSYRDSLQRAFNRAKEQVYFNPDMTNFITLTYAKEDNSIEEVLHDVKMLIKRENRLADRAERGELKYLYIMEYQERGSIHVHMIANDSFSLQVNSNGYKELTYWAKGFSSVLQITDFDQNFRPHLYLFKYMRKSQRIGKSFVHASRNLKNYETTDEHLELSDWNTSTMEYTTAEIQNTNFQFYKNYLKYNPHATLDSQTNKESTQWQPKTKQQLQSHLKRALAEIQDVPTLP